MERYEGRRGIITVETLQGEKRATKSAKDTTKKGAINKEIQILKYLEEKGIDFVPQVIDCGDGWFSYPRREGNHFRKERKIADTEKRKQLVLQLLERAYQLDCVGVVHGEFIRPYTNMIVGSKKGNQMKKMKSDEKNETKGNTSILHDTRGYTNTTIHKTNKTHQTSSDFIISIIDFERGTMGDFSGKNMRSLSQWLLAEGYLTLEECKNIGNMKREEIFSYLQKKLVIKKEDSMKKSEQRDGGKNNKCPFCAGMNLYFFSFFILLLFLDQGSKYLFYDMRWGEQWWLFTPAFNTGIGRSIPLPLWLVNSITLVVIAFVVRLWKRKYLGSWVTVFLLSGALGNVIDRIMLGGVRDFIDLHYRPIFNLADVYLSIAGILLVWKVFIGDNKQ